MKLKPEVRLPSIVIIFGVLNQTQSINRLLAFRPSKVNGICHAHSEYIQNFINMSDSEKSDWTLMMVNQPKSDDPEITEIENTGSYKFAVNASWVVNWILLIIKIVAVILSNSKAVTAALVDSAVDLVSQAVLSLADRYISRHSPEYPVGRSRLEALSVIACAFIMSMASIEGMRAVYLIFVDDWLIKRL